MALPINTTPTYTLVVPSSNVEVKYRPFLIKEEKMAKNPAPKQMKPKGPAVKMKKC